MDPNSQFDLSGATDYVIVFETIPMDPIGLALPSSHHAPKALCNLHYQQSQSHKHKKH